MVKTAGQIKNISFNKSTNFIISDKEKESMYKCKLIQETDWLFIFKHIRTNKIICIRKVDYYLNASLIKVVKN